MSEAIDRLFSRTSGQSVQKSGGPPPAPTGASGQRIQPDEQFRDIPADMLIDMDQPFRTYYDGPEMENLRQSILRSGIIQRVVVRPYGDKYQIISGRHRRTGAQQAGIMVPCEIKTLSDDEARLMMIDANLQQRERLLPSEKGWAYRERMEVLNRQGIRTDLTSCRDGTKLRSDEELAAEVPDSARQIHRYIKLTYLVDNLLALVDSGQLSMTAGEVLADLSMDDQQTVEKFFFGEEPRPLQGPLAKQVVDISRKGPLTDERLLKLVTKPPKPPKQVAIPMRTIKKYIPTGLTAEQVKSLLVKALKEYYESHGVEKEV